MVEDANNNNTKNNEILNGFNTLNSFNLYPTSNHQGEDFTVFPPSNHENLVPSQFNPDPVDLPPSSPPPSYSPVLPRWWFVSVEILSLRIANIWSCFGCGGRRAFRQFGNVTFAAAAAAVVGWWLWVRVRRRMRRRRRENVDHLLRIISEKNERIVQLLNQIAQMNEVLLARHKTLASRN